MKSNHSTLVLIGFCFLLGIGYFLVNNSQTEIPGLPFLNDAKVKNFLLAKAYSKDFGKKFDFNLLEKIADKDVTYLYVWNTEAFWGRIEFLELRIHKDNSIDVRCIIYAGTPEEGKFIYKNSFKASSNQSERTLKALESANFWRAAHKAPKGLPLDGSWWIIEGLEDGKIVRWTSQIKDDSSPDAQSLGYKICKILSEDYD